MPVLIAALLAILAAAVPVVLFARRRPGYSHVRQTISELGEAGADDAREVAIFGFAPAAHGIWLFVAALAWTVPLLAQGSGVWLLAGLGAGFLAAAIFPCDPGAPLIGSWRNNLHNLLAGLGYLSGAAGVYFLGDALERADVAPFAASLATPIAVVVVAGLLLMFPANPFRGLAQRVATGAIHAWMLLLALELLTG